MDRNSFIGLILITVLIFAWLIYMSYQSVPIPKEDREEQVIELEALEKQDSIDDSLEPIISDSISRAGEYGAFSQFAEGHETIYTVETSLYRARISSKGAAIKFWTLHNYNKWDQVPVQLINNPNGELFINFVSLDAKRIDSRNLNFTLNNIKNTEFNLSNGDSLLLDFVIDFGGGRRIVKSMTFFDGSYHIDKHISVENLEDVMPTRGYNLIWEKGLVFQENNSVDEAAEAQAMVQMNGSVVEVNADNDHGVEKSLTGTIDYAAIKTKYFGMAIIPQPWREFDGTVDVEGSRKHHKNEGITESYTVSYRIPYRGGVQSNNFKVYIGPLEYDIVKEYGLGEMISLGWRFLIRPIAEYFMLPIFTFIHKYVPNYGIAILIFALIIKIILHPLSITQMKSAQKMKLLQPEMEKIREQHKDDNSAQQKAIMKLYSEYGVNPASGCLPLILQMPILFSLWSLLRSSIELRQAPFMLWITDLSVPDKIFEFGFSFFGIGHLSGLALLMGITMFIQQKMTITDPRQKALVYMMPIMLTFLFAHFPSGLNLYYFFFNLLAISQQYYMNNFSKNKPTLAEMKKAPKKEGWLQKKMREAQEIAEAQGRSIPGKKLPQGNTQNRPIPPKKKKK